MCIFVHTTRSSTGRKQNSNRTSTDPEDEKRHFQTTIKKTSIVDADLTDRGEQEFKGPSALIQCVRSVHIPKKQTETVGFPHLV